VTIHDLHFLDRPERTSAEIRRDYPALVRDHARRADRVLTPSRFTASEIERRLDVAPDRITVCPHGAPDWQPRTARPTDGYILFFGTLEPRKNVAGLLDAYELLLQQRPAARPERSRGEAGRYGNTDAGLVPELVLAGKATDESGPWLERIARPPLSGHVRSIGYVDPAERRSLYAGARLLVQPSFEEGFGLPVLEAMTVGVPVVASNRGALPEVLGDAGPLVDPDQPTALASAIARLLDDDGFAGACAAKGIERARAFNWPNTAHLVYDAYQRAIAHRRARPEGGR
jgi:alpha-1,3-rhamnosyl/mannosyltransferase